MSDRDPRFANGGIFAIIGIAFWAIVALVILIALAVFSPAFGKTITNDKGGSVTAYITKVNIGILNGEKIMIDGWCASACTMYLSNPNACVTPRAILAFHGASGGTRAENDRMTRKLAQNLPPAVREWFMANAAHLRGDQHATLRAKDLARMGVRRCQ